MEWGLSASSQERLYPFFELIDEGLARIDLHNGSVGDWIEVLGDATLTAVSLESYSTSGRHSDYDPVDLDFRISSTSRMRTLSGFGGQRE